MGEKRLIELRYYLASPCLNPGRQSVSIFKQSRSKLELPTHFSPTS